MQRKRGKKGRALLAAALEKIGGIAGDLLPFSASQRAIRHK